MCSISETKFKNILRTYSGWFLTKHPINKNYISLNTEIACVLTCGCLPYQIGSVPHFSAIWTGIRTEAEVNCRSEELEPTDKEVNVEEWGMAFSVPNPFGHPLRLDVWCMWTTCSSYGLLLSMLRQMVFHVVTSGYQVVCDIASLELQKSWND